MFSGNVNFSQDKFYYLKIQSVFVISIKATSNLTVRSILSEQYSKHKQDNDSFAGI